MLATQDDKQLGVTAAPRFRFAIITRAAAWLVIAFTIGWVLNRLGHHFDRDGHTAGFGRGFVQGALMPMALPNLAFGSDVNIYTTNNSGVHYKLGYTAGVNACGMLFFGVFFWRLRRWRSLAQRENVSIKD